MRDYFLSSNQSTWINTRQTYQRYVYNSGNNKLDGMGWDPLLPPSVQMRIRGPSIILPSFLGLAPHTVFIPRLQFFTTSSCKLIVGFCALPIMTSSSAGSVCFSCCCRVIQHTRRGFCLPSSTDLCTSPRPHTLPSISALSRPWQ